MRRDWMTTARRIAPPLRTAIARALRGPRRIAWIDRTLAQTADFLLDCPTVRRHLSDAHDHVLTPWQDRLIQAHVRTCAVCGPVNESLHATTDLLRGLRDEST